MVVYLIKNKINGRLYVGQTVRAVEARWYQHTRCNGCPVLRAAIEKYGSENFQITVLKECISKKKSLEHRQALSKAKKKENRK